nr:G-protein coupled receptor 39 isoform X2 [Columba livia]
MAEQTSSSDCSDLIDHSHVPEFEVSSWIKITLALVYVCLFVAGILGNSITIKATRILQKKGYLQKEVTDHMVSLACSDLLVILLGMPMEFFSAIWSPFSTPNGNVACKLYYFLFEACSYATVLHVATLSFERYIAICHPFKFKAVSGPRTVKLLIAFVWGTSVIVALPLLFAMGTEYPLEAVEGYQSKTACTTPMPRHHIPELKQNATICTSLSSQWPVFQASIFSSFAVYIIVLGSVTFMCRSMMKALMIHKEGTVAVKGGPRHEEQYLRKNESSEGKSTRRQITLFLVFNNQGEELLPNISRCQEEGSFPALHRQCQGTTMDSHKPSTKQWRFWLEMEIRQKCYSLRAGTCALLSVGDLLGHESSTALMSFNRHQWRIKGNQCWSK